MTAQEKLDELQGERASIDAVMTKEDLSGQVDEWLATARAQAAGSSRLVLGGQASGDHLAQVLHEDRLDDAGLAGRIVARLEAQGFGALSNREKSSKLKALDSAIAKASQEVREAAKAEALARVEEQYAAVERQFADEAA
jgi:hypothetical protein